MNETLRVDKKGLKERLEGMGIKGLSQSHILSEVYVMLSLGCNLRCKVCSWWGIKGPCRSKGFLEKYRSSLTLKELKRFADEIAPFHPRTVSFSGGEPLLYKKWYLLAGYLRKKRIKVSLTTNGVLLQENFTKVKDVVDEINLSLDRPPSISPLIKESPDFHFHRIMKGLKAVTDFKKKNANKPSLRILYTISDLSYAYMQGLIEFMEKHNINIDHYIFQHLMFITPETFKEQKETYLREFKIKDLSLWQGYTYSPLKFNFRKFQEEIEKVKQHKNVSFSPNLSKGELMAYYCSNKGALGYARFCTAPWHQLNIMPDGQIYICNDYFIGNIKEGPFEKTWNGVRAKRLRGYLSKKLFSGCKGCFYHYCDRAK